MWYRQLRALRERFNVMLVDLRGHGKSAKRIRDDLATPYTFAAIAGDVVETLDHHEIDTAHFVGLSLGSTIVRALAHHWPDRVLSMVLGGAIVRLNLRARLLMRLGYHTRAVIPYMWLYRFFAWIVMPGPQHRLSRDLFAREARTLGQAEFARWFRLATEVEPLLRTMEQEPSGVPALYLSGDEDYMFLPFVRRLTDTHHEARLEIIPESGHVCNLERADLFNAKALAFLQDISTRASVTLPASSGGSHN